MKALSRTVSVLALGLLAAPAMADVTAAELWADWQENAAAMAGTMTADVTETGSGLLLTNVTITQDQQGAMSTQSVDQVELIENGDGTVSIVPSQPYRIRSEVSEDGQLMAAFEFLVTYEGLDVVASGDMTDLTYAYSADTITMSEGEIMDATGSGTPEMNVAMTAMGVASTYRLTGSGDARDLVSEVSWDGLNVELDAAAPAGETGQFKMSMAVGPGSGDANGSLSAFQTFTRTLASAQPGQSIEMPEGLALDGALTYDSLTWDFQVQEPGNSVAANGQNGGGEIGFGFGESGLSYALSAVDTSVNVTGSQIPFPVNLAAAATGFSIQVPMVAAPEPSDMALALNYTDLTVNDEVWMMVDPGGAIPRDPATLDIDLTGTVQLFTDLFAMDPATMAGPPGELRSLDLNTLLLRAAGAELTGSGALTFQPGAMPPMPTGTIDLALQGLNGLLDRLTAAGMLPVEQAGMMRGMAGMFARPGAGPDTLETTIEFLPGGGITANGIPLQ
ncbi:DUF2125 domain-containing protein [Rhodobacterales bacterium HKCCE3408]|nr:DUF2125 domain-containing protein [Rhodobacterales bacterium HKCCE3408]